MRRLLLVGIAAVLAAPAADLTGPQLLTQVRAKMARTLAEMPNYTCRETIQRFNKLPGSAPFELRDVIRVDVAYLSSRELYAWPGSPFGDRSLIEMVPDGAIGTGNFASLSKAVFAANGPIFVFEGFSSENRRKQARFSFRVPLEYSTYAVRYGRRAADVAYHGWFTADAGTLDVISFDVAANEIPRDLETLQAIEHTEYAQSRISSRDFLLPTNADVLLMDLSGGLSRNHINFERCREYRGESTVTFTDPGATPAAQPAPLPPQKLPANVELQVRLSTPIDATSAIGDMVSATLSKEVRRPIAFPKGTTVRLRITGMDVLTLGKKTYHTVKLELQRVEPADRQYAIAGAALQHVTGRGVSYGTVDGRIPVAGASLRIPAGMEMIWLTQR
jgi:hypothetical protein